MGILKRKWQGNVWNNIYWNKTWLNRWKSDNPRSGDFLFLLYRNIYLFIFILIISVKMWTRNRGKEELTGRKVLSLLAFWNSIMTSKENIILEKNSPRFTEILPKTIQFPLVEDWLMFSTVGPRNSVGSPSPSKFLCQLIICKVVWYFLLFKKHWCRILSDQLTISKPWLRIACYSSRTDK